MVKSFLFSALTPWPRVTPRVTLISVGPSSLLTPCRFLTRLTVSPWFGNRRKFLIKFRKRSVRTFLLGRRRLLLLGVMMRRVTIIGFHLLFLRIGTGKVVPLLGGRFMFTRFIIPQLIIRRHLLLTRGRRRPWWRGVRLLFPVWGSTLGGTWRDCVDLRRRDWWVTVGLARNLILVARHLHFGRHLFQLWDRRRGFILRRKCYDLALFFAAVFAVSGDAVY